MYFSTNLLAVVPLSACKLCLPSARQTARQLNCNISKAREALKRFASELRDD